MEIIASAQKRTYIWCEEEKLRRSLDYCSSRCVKQYECDEYLKNRASMGDDRRRKAEELDNKVGEMKNSIFDTYFDMGLALKEIRDEGLYKELGYESLEKYVEDRHRFKYRKAAYLISIVENCQLAGIEKEDIRGVEWSKMKEITPVLTDENRGEWLLKARDMSVEQLRKAVKEAQGEQDYEEKYYLGFSLSPGQKEVVDRALEIAGLLAGSDVKSYQLEIMAQEFIGTYGAMDEMSVKRFKNLYMDSGDAGAS